MLAAATPTTRKHVSAMMVIAFVKQFSVSFREQRSLSRELAGN
jgi:hypothetical protein